MKTPLTYYGGKQRLADKIIKLIPKHNLYCEPFVGGGAVFFRKEPSPVEVINDINSELINFYEVVQRDFVSLEKEVTISLHSRDLHRRAQVIYQNPDMFDKIKRAWAVWVLANLSFASNLNNVYAYSKTVTRTRAFRNKRDSFTYEMAIRLQDVQIECADALRIIRSRDGRESFFYCDPPYYNADMGHYDGYTKEDFKMLLDALSGIKGKFLLSSYPGDLIGEYVKQNGWHRISLNMSLSAPLKPKRKIEVLTANYELLRIDES